MPSTPPLWSRLRRGADRFIHHPVTDFAVVTLIVSSVVALLAEPAFPLDSESRVLLEWLGHGITWVFIAELSLRWWVAPRKRHHASPCCVRAKVCRSRWAEMSMTLA